MRNKEEKKNTYEHFSYYSSFVRNLQAKAVGANDTVCLFIHPDFISVECAATAHVHRGGSGDGTK